VKEVSEYEDFIPGRSGFSVLDISDAVAVYACVVGNVGFGELELGPLSPELFCRIRLGLLAQPHIIPVLR